VGYTVQKKGWEGQIVERHDLQAHILEFNFCMLWWRRFLANDYGLPTFLSAACS